jgi:hypothetical protein
MWVFIFLNLWVSVDLDLVKVLNKCHHCLYQLQREINTYVVMPLTLLVVINLMDVVMHHYSEGMTPQCMSYNDLLGYCRSTFTLTMDTLFSSKTLVTIYQTTQPEDNNHKNLHCHKDLKSHICHAVLFLLCLLAQHWAVLASRHFMQLFMYMN